MKWAGLECNVSNINILFSLMMYASFFVLFGQFFYKSYITPKKAKQEVKIKDN